MCGWGEHPMVRYPNQGPSSYEEPPKEWGDIQGHHGFMSQAEAQERMDYIHAQCQNNPFKEQMMREPGSYLEIPGNDGLLPRFF